MNEDKKISEKLKNILKQEGLEIPSDEFSSRLAGSIVHKYGRAQRADVNTAFGKIILSLLILFNVMFLFRLIPFSMQPALLTCLCAFVAGLWGVISLIKKIHNAQVVETKSHQ